MTKTFILGLMDFIIVLIFLLVMAAAVYRRLLDNAKKDAARKCRPPLHETPPSRETDAPAFEAEGVPVFSPCAEGEGSPSQKKKKGKKQGVRKPEKKTEQPQEARPLADLRNVSEARRAFIYSEIFKRKYE